VWSIDFSELVVQKPGIFAAAIIILCAMSLFMAFSKEELDHSCD